MTTPSKQEIYGKALEMWKADQYRHGCAELAQTNPEIGELREDGYLNVATSELMTNAETKHREWIHNGSELENLVDFQFDSAEAMRTTCFISGSRGVGKSDIAMRIAEQLQNEGITVIVFDPSMDWIKRSSIQHYFTVKPFSDLPIPETSAIFDISRLTPNQAQRSVEQFCKKLFEFQVDNLATKVYIVFEESQIYFPLSALSSKRTQNSMRLLTVGRNFNISLCAISQFPALVSKELVKHSQQLWIGCCAEPNTIKYWRGMIGAHAEKLKQLSNGQFIYYHRNKISLTEIESYESEARKTQIQIPEPEPTQPIKPKEQISVVPFLRLGMIVGFAILLIGALR